MQILIDNQNLDFALEGEKRLGEVVVAVERWLGDSRFVISSLRVDNDDLPLYSPERWRNHPVTDVERVEIGTSTVREAKLASYQTILEYLVILQKAVRDKREGEAAELVREYPYIYRGLVSLTSGAARTNNAAGSVPGTSAADGDSVRAARVAGANAPDPGIGLEAGRSENRLVDPLHRALEDSGLFGGSIRSDEDRAEVVEKIRLTTVLLFDRMKEITHPVEEAAITAGLLGGAIPAIGDVSVLLQTGKDEEAMKAILRFSEILSKLLRIIPFLTDERPEMRTSRVDGKTIEETTAEMNGFLSEVVEALSAQDSVLVGDLLEYEVAPRALALVRFFGTGEPATGGSGAEAAQPPEQP